MFFVQSNEGIPFCPVCQSPMKPYDYRKRIMKQYDGETEYLILRRCRCTNNGCNKLHIQLPDLLLPHKHYAASIIEETIEDREDNLLMIPDYPCQDTLSRWKKWFASALPCTDNEILQTDPAPARGSDFLRLRRIWGKRNNSCCITGIVL